MLYNKRFSKWGLPETPIGHYILLLSLISLHKKMRNRPIRDQEHSDEQDVVTNSEEESDDNTSDFSGPKYTSKSGMQ